MNWKNLMWFRKTVPARPLLKVEILFYDGTIIELLATAYAYSEGEDVAGAYVDVQRTDGTWKQYRLDDQICEIMITIV